MGAGIEAVVARYIPAGGKHPRPLPVRLAAAELAARGLPARWLRWALSPRSLAPPVALAPSLQARLATSAVLVGRPYARRVALVRELAEQVPGKVEIGRELAEAGGPGVFVQGPQVSFRGRCARGGGSGEQ